MWKMFAAFAALIYLAIFLYCGLTYSWVLAAVVGLVGIVLLIIVLIAIWIFTKKTEERFKVY